MVRKILLPFLVVAAVLAPVSASAQSTQERLHDIDQQLGAAVTDATFLRAERIEDVRGALADEYGDLHAALVQAGDDFSAAAAGAEGARDKGFAQAFAQATDDIDRALGEMHTAAGLPDEEEIKQAALRFADALDAYQAEGDRYNTYLGATASGGGDLLAVYGVLLALSCGAAIGAFAFWQRGDVTGEPEIGQKLQDLRRRIFLASLIPVAGSSITYFWYRYVINHGGGTYVVLYGPMLIGFVVFALQVRDYRQVTRRLRTRQVSPSI